MSLNKVLNRPMFRKEALRKGVLKTINANTGVMVGQPYTFSTSSQLLRKPPTFMERMSVRPSVRFLKEAASIPVNLGFTAGDKVADAFGIDPGFGVARTGLQTLGAYGASRALPGLAVSAIGLGPTALGLGAIYGSKKLYEAGVKERARINAMSPAERKAFEIEQRNSCH